MEEIIDIEGSGGSCFPPGTLINTPLGYRKIEEITPGDQVYSFNPINGNVQISRVSETFTHASADDLIILDYGTGSICLTANHWVFHKNKRRGEYFNFDEAGTLSVGDTLITEYGEQVIIEKIYPGPEVDFVYNLEVEDNHTFIAAKIRVHNGGGGKKGSKPHVHYEAPNDLRSKAIVRVLEVISEGEIQGLATPSEPGKSVFFDSTPVQNSDGTYNFGSVSITQRVGLPSQTYIPGFPLVEAERVVDVVVTKATPIVRAMTNTGVTACRVTISLPNGLYKQDTTNGDVFGYNVSFTIDHRPPGGTWVHARSDTISGKTMGVYERSYRIENPNSTGLWEVRVTRTSDNAVGSDIQDKINFSRITEITDLALSYDNTAYVGGTVDAESTGGRLPIRAYDVYGLKIKVPNNYTPSTRTYSGTWNGTFQTAWTDNPAWVLYDLLTNTRYGLGEFIKDYNVDKYSFYNAAVYNDVLVNDGQGSGLFTPRYTFNGQILQQEESWKLLQAIASTMRAALYIGGGIVKLIQDRPSSAVKLVSRANVIDGLFTYSSTTARERHTAVNVVFNDPNDSYLPKIITMEDTAGIARYGYNLTELTAYGCTVESQARRLGRWVLETEMNSTEMVVYRAGFNQADIQPGDVIKIMDDDYASTVQAGKVVSATTTSITVDRTVTIANGTLDLVSSDGKTIVTKALSNGANTNVLTWSGAITAPAPWSDWMITGAVSPRLFRVVMTKEVEAGVVEITAIFYDPNKYARVEQGTYFPTTSYFTAPSNVPVHAVKDITWTPQSYTDAAGKVSRFLRVKWSPDAADFVTSYSYKWQRGLEDWVSGDTQSNVLEIPADYSGLYTIYIYAYSAYGAQSPAATSSYTLDLTNAAPTSTFLPVTNIRVVDIGGTTFNQKDCNITWDDPNVNNPVAGQTVQDYEITVRDAATQTLVYRTIITNQRETSYTFDMNMADNANQPKRTFVVRIRIRDTFNRYSPAAQATFTNPAPPAPILVLTPGVGIIWIDVKENPEVPDAAGYIVCMGTSTNFVPSVSNQISKGFTSSVSIQSPGNSIRYFTAAVFDNFSEAIGDLNWSTQGSAASVPDVVPNEWKIDGLTFKGNDPTTNSVSWTACTVMKTQGNSGIGTSVSLPAGNAAWTSGTLYVYYKEGQTTLLATNVINTAITDTSLVVATYKGGLQVFTGNGKVFIDGANIYANTIGATQLVAGQAVITGTAQLGNAVVGTAAIGSAVINSSHIQDAVITTAKIQDASITNAKIQDASITTAKIQDASITAAKIGNAQIGNAQIVDVLTSTNFALGSTGWGIRASDGYAEFNNVRARGDITATSLNAATGTFTGMVNVGNYTGYAWPPAGQTGVHLSSNGILAGNSNGGGKYFQIFTPAGGQAAIYTNIPAYIETAQIQTLHVGNGALSGGTVVASGSEWSQSHQVGYYSENTSSSVTIGNASPAIVPQVLIGAYATPSYSGMPGSIPTLITCSYYTNVSGAHSSIFVSEFLIYFGGSNPMSLTHNVTVKGYGWHTVAYPVNVAPGASITVYYTCNNPAIITTAGTQVSLGQTVAYPRFHVLQTYK